MSRAFFQKLLHLGVGVWGLGSRFLSGLAATQRPPTLRSINPQVDRRHKVPNRYDIE